MEEKKKNTNVSLIIIVILVLLIMGGFLYFIFADNISSDNMLDNKDKKASATSETKKDNSEIDLPDIYTSIDGENVLVFGENNYKLLYVDVTTRESSGKVNKESDFVYKLGDEIELNIYDDIAIVKNVYQKSETNKESNLVLFKAVKDAKLKMYETSVDFITNYYKNKNVSKINDIYINRVDGCYNYDNDDNMVCTLIYTITFDEFDESNCAHNDEYAYEISPICLSDGIQSSYPIRFDLKTFKATELASHNM